MRDCWRARAAKGRGEALHRGDPGLREDGAGAKRRPRSRAASPLRNVAGVDLQLAMQSKTFSVPTKAREEMVLITQSVESALHDMTAGEGICTIFTPHTTAALTINENADPDVPADLLNAFRALVPKIHFDHGEGNSDAHFLSALIGCSLQVPYRDGRLLLGRWQGVFFVELDGPRRREVTVYVS